MNTRPTIVVIGAGIAGASAAFTLAERADVVLLEREGQAGYHTTGRSAATYVETYGDPVIRGLTRASHGFLSAPPPGFADVPLVRPLGEVNIGRPDQVDRLDQVFAANHAYTDGLQRLDGEETRKLVPYLAPDYVAGSVYEPNAQAIEVDALHQGYLRGLRLLGGRLVTNAGLTAIERRDGQWHLALGGEAIRADMVIDAAGAWADEVAAMAGLQPVGLMPKRRTACIVDVPGGGDSAGLPMVNDIDDRFYAKPEGGRLMLSPADETPVAPQDVQPEDLDVAVAVDRFEQATGRPVERVGRRWAGLRTFAFDRVPVVGPDPDVESFGWLAGQGGIGIMTAPAMARLIAGLMLDGEVPADLPVSAAAIAPLRCRLPNAVSESSF
ncbi:NAD(P)/FAD-dependent oxidoreductase [Marinivivus vitaminiproducens]|uniref:NAD(P)/FAD-dependent oxidoreductase n=1 Tax=Marinivivus vitaminiproducens TaxID=3035935 RepID=UPI0027A5B6FF|nr:FAD-binding oxidoreductase [Geminicoccaceae bacterium SCSIO 64248]